MYLISRSHSYLMNFTVVVVGSLLLALSSKVSVPFYPVPMTMQPLVVLLIGFLLSPSLSIATVALYLVEGMFNLPVFQGTPEKGIGIAYMLGPTGGYLLGFLFAVSVIAYLKTILNDRKIVSMFIIYSLAMVAIYLPGVLWLGTIVGWDKPVLQWGLTPFLLGDAVKIIIAVLITIGVGKIQNNNNQ